MKIFSLKVPECECWTGDFVVAMNLLLRWQNTEGTDWVQLLMSHTQLTEGCSEVCLKQGALKVLENYSKEGFKLHSYPMSV